MSQSLSIETDRSGLGDAAISPPSEISWRRRSRPSHMLSQSLHLPLSQSLQLRTPSQSLHLRTLSPLRAGNIRAILPSEITQYVLQPETVLEPLNAATPPLLRTVVWTDFRLAVTLFVVVPFSLLIWSVAESRRSQIGEVSLRYMTSYWQASSLLLITVAFNVQQEPLGVATGLIAQAMILVSLWWWSDLNDELERAESSALLAAFSTWRGLASVAAAGGVLVQAPFQPCLALSVLTSDPSCAAWLEPPVFAAGVIGLSPSPALAALARGFCALYASVLAYYATVLIPTVGRRGRAPRPPLMNVASPIGAWRMLGFIREQDGS